MAQGSLYDVVIVGGAAMGSAVAYFLAADPDFNGRVLVIERDPSYENSATARSWGGLRQQFSTPENIEIGLFGLSFLREFQERLAVDGEAPDPQFHENGYLFLEGPSGRATLEANVALQRKLGADIVVLEPDDVGRKFPHINLEGVAAASFSPSGEGWLDPNALMQGFRKKAQSLGVTYQKAEVASLKREGDRITGVILQDGQEISAGLVVNAAGPWAGALAATADIALPVTPRKRMSFTFDCREELPPKLPLTVDISGVTCRPEGAHFIAIVSPPAEIDPDCPDLEEDYSLFDEIIWPALAHRIPAFEAIKLVGAWAGHYDYNSFDQNAIIGAHPEIAGLTFCNGFSGHGIQQSPAAGRAVAELIVHGGFKTLDLSRFSFSRIAANQPLTEEAVV